MRQYVVDAFTEKVFAGNPTHVGDPVGTGLYYYGEETAFALKNCAVSGEITGVFTPGAIAGRAENSTIENCTFDVTLDGASLGEIGATDCRYESADQCATPMTKAARHTKSVGRYVVAAARLPV